jgi:hypothetical protein
LDRARTAADYSDVLASLEASGARYVVVGGAAVVAHGRDRSIGDLDLAVDVTPQNATLVMQTLSSVGFFPTLPLPLAALTILRTADSAGRSVDLIARPYVPFSELWSGSTLAPLGSVSARVASLEHVLQAKRQSGRPEDLADIDALLELG